jgi:hypothetical protein
VSPRDARAHEGHIDAARRRGRGRREPPLQPRHLVQRQARATELGRHEQPQVARVAELLEVLGKEPVVEVVAVGALAESREARVGQVRFGEFAVAGFAVRQCGSSAGWAVGSRSS